MKYFHFHDWTGEELAAAARIPPRQMEIRDSARVCVGHTEGRGSRRKEKSQIQWSSGGTEKERERRSLSFSFQPYIFLSLTFPVAVTGWEVAAC